MFLSYVPRVTQSKLTSASVTFFIKSERRPRPSDADRAIATGSVSGEGERPHRYVGSRHDWRLRLRPGVLETRSDDPWSSVRLRLCGWIISRRIMARDCILAMRWVAPFRSEGLCPGNYRQRYVYVCGAACLVFWGGSHLFKDWCFPLEERVHMIYLAVISRRVLAQMIRYGYRKISPCDDTVYVRFVLHWS